MQVEQHDYVLQAGLLSLATTLKTERIPVPVSSWLVGIMIHSPGVVIDTPCDVEVYKNDAAMSPRVFATYSVAALAGDVGATVRMESMKDHVAAVITRGQAAHFDLGDSIEILSGGDATATGLTCQVSLIMRKGSL